MAPVSRAAGEWARLGVALLAVLLWAATAVLLVNEGGCDTDGECEVATGIAVEDSQR